MTNTTEQMKTLFDEYVAENTKFDTGNAAAGKRARKALAELGKLAKTRRNEITEEKTARKDSKKSK